jgi:hypothetical protein
MADDVTVRIGANAKAASSAIGNFAESFAAIGVAAGAAGTAIFALTNRVTSQVDALGKMSTAIGVSTEFLSGLEIAAELGGTNVETLGIAKDTFKELGIEVKDAQGNLKNAEVLLPEVADKLQEMGAGAEATAAAMNIFGKAGTKLIPTLLEGSEGFTKAADEARRFGTIVTEEAAASAAIFQDTMLRVIKVGDGFLKQIGLGLAPGLTQLAQLFLDNTTSSANFGKAIGDFANQELIGFVQFVKEAGERISQLAQIASEIGERGGIIGLIKAKFTGEDEGNILGTIERIGRETEKRIERIRVEVNKPFTGPKNIFANTVAPTSDFAKNLEKTVAKPGEKLGKKAAKSLEDESKSIGMTIGEAYALVAARAIKGFTTGSVTTMAQGVAELFGPAGQVASAVIGLFDALGKDPNFVNNLITSFTEGILGGIKNLPDMLRDLAPRLIPEIILPLIDAIPELIKELVESIPFIIAGIIEHLPELVAALIRLTALSLGDPFFTARVTKAFVQGFVDAFTDPQFIVAFVQSWQKAFEEGLLGGLRNVRGALRDALTVNITGGGGGGGVGGGDGGNVVQQVGQVVGLGRRASGASTTRTSQGSAASTSTGGTLTIQVSDSITATLFQAFADAINNGNPSGVQFSHIVVSTGSV